MRHLHRPLAALGTVLLLLPYGGFAADQGIGSPAYRAGSFSGRFLNPYSPARVPVPNFNNSSRLESLLRAGNLYLSLADAVSLGLENNLDLQLQRYGALQAEADILGAEAGGFAGAASTQVIAGPASVTGGAPSPGLQGYFVQASNAVGDFTPNLDPAIVGTVSLAHNTTPQSSSFTTGQSALVNRNVVANVGVQKNFLTGTFVNLGLNNNNVNTNNQRAQFSPSTTSSLGLNLTQHLLRGFSRTVNSRNIRIAKNNRAISDLTFKAQVITTISAITNLYWDLVTFNQTVRVRRQALAASQVLLEDDRKQVEVGTLAPIEVTRAEAEVAAGEQAVTVAENQLLQQETILKNALTRTGMQSPEIASAHVILTDTIQVPPTEAIVPIQDLTATAFNSRPELAQYRILMENSNLALMGAKDALKPIVDLVAATSNAGLAGSVNPTLTGAPAPSQFFVGGYGNVLSQIFSRNFPTYSFGLNVNLPLRNRGAQSDVIASELSIRQQVVGRQRMENQVRVEVQNALIGVQQARAQYNSAVKQRTLQEETVSAERKKLDAGVSTTYNVILTERDLVTAQSNEVQALSAYAKARVELERVTGQTLNANGISMDEAVSGTVTRAPSPLPPAPAPAPQRQ